MRLLFAGLLLCALPAASEPVVNLSLHHVKVGKSCEQRTITWAQTGATPSRWEVELARVFTNGAAVAYDTPRVFTVMQTRWQGVIGEAGVYRVRVRACNTTWTPECTPWTDSTTAGGTLNSQPWVFDLYVCPPTNFQPN